VLAGGTGQYVWGLLEGWEAAGGPPDPALREALEREVHEKGVEAAYARLLAADPEAAAAVDRRNPRRVVRALERVAAGRGGLPGKAAQPPFDALIIGLTMPRRELYERIDRRIDAMVATGWLDEVRRLLEAGVPLEAPAMSGIGYREMAAHLAGEMTIEQATAAAKRATRRLVRHQYNWFKLDDPRITWLGAGPPAFVAAAAVVRRWLSATGAHR
jgi:tRNA dimethylallyltransferase